MSRKGKAMPTGSEKKAEPVGQPPSAALPKRVYGSQKEAFFQKPPDWKARKIGSVRLTGERRDILILRFLLTALAVIAADTLPQFSAFFFGHAAVSRRRKL